MIDDAYDSTHGFKTLFDEGPQIKRLEWGMVIGKSNGMANGEW
jgi:hypothetical protein